MKHITIPASVTREALEALAKQEGMSILEIITVLQGAAALLYDDEATLEALCAIKSEILDKKAGTPSEPKFPNVHVRLSGEDGNVFSIIGRVRAALRRGGATGDDLKAFVDEVTAAGSYDDALLTVMRWVDAS